MNPHALLYIVSIHIASEGAMRHNADVESYDNIVEFQSTPDPKRRCNVLTEGESTNLVVVSTLTISEEVVQHKNEVHLFVLPVCFNSHHLRRSGATVVEQFDYAAQSYEFQSSPPPKRRCNTVQQSDAGPTLSGFNPHRLRRGNATAAGYKSLSPASIVADTRTSFQCIFSHLCFSHFCPLRIHLLARCPLDKGVLLLELLLREPLCSAGQYS